LLELVGAMILAVRMIAGIAMTDVMAVTILKVVLMIGLAGLCS
jgi:hypothetical protein